MAPIARLDTMTSQSYLQPNKCMAETTTLIFTAQKFEQLATGKVTIPQKNERTRRYKVAPYQL